ncbi:GGDEF domain-containing protein [Sphingomonas sp. RS6]
MSCIASIMLQMTSQRLPAIQEIGLAAMVAATGLSSAYAFDFIHGQSAEEVHLQQIELAELALLGALYLGMLIVYLVRTIGPNHSRRQRSSGTQATQLATDRDLLTGLANRQGFEARVAAEFAAMPLPGQSHALFLLEIKRIRSVDQHLGHATRDAVRRVVAKRLAAAVRGSDCTARLNGDRFAVIFTAIDGEGAAEAIARRLCDAIEAPIEIGRHMYGTALGMGMVLNRGQAFIADEWMRRAEVALDTARRVGRHPWAFYTPYLGPGAAGR